MGEHNFLVSVLIPNYNHAQFLVQRIESILNQTYHNFELILMDDCSTDNSRDIIGKYKNHAKVSKVYYNKENSGSPFGLWEKGFDLARGKYIWIAESDDWADKDFLKLMLQSINGRDPVVAHCRSYNANSEGKFFGLNNWWSSFNLKIWDTNYCENGPKLLKLYGKYKCPVINVSSALINKSYLEKINIPSEFRYCGDWWFWGQLFMLGKVQFCANGLNYFRFHIKSATGKKNSNNYDRIIENFEVIALINSMLNAKIKYNKNYLWLIEMMVHHAIVKREFLKFIKSDKIPLSFLVIFYINLIKTLYRKYLFT